MVDFAPDGFASNHGLSRFGTAVHMAPSMTSALLIMGMVSRPGCLSVHTASPPAPLTFSSRPRRVPAQAIHADSHNGRPDIPENFVPILDSINGGVMRAFEVMVRNKALDGNVVEYRRIITYVDNPANAAERLIPKSIQLEAYIDGKLIAQTPALDNWGGKLTPTP